MNTAMTVPKRLFSIDLRSLAAFRMALGVLLLADLVMRAQDLSAHYTDWGVLPRDILSAHFLAPLRFSLHLVAGSSSGQALIFLMAGVFALALLVGFCTPLVTCASWLLLLSVQARNPSVLNAGDALLHLLLFWGMFVPLGARYSLDSLIRRRADRSPLPTSLSSMGTAALLLQVCLVYWGTAALKSLDMWWYEASALYYALSLDQMVTPFGLWLLGFPDLLALLSRASIVLEFLGPCLVFVPFCTPWLRIFVVGAFFGFHIGIALCLSIGLFPYVSMVSWLVFVPSLVWNCVSTPAVNPLQEERPPKPKRRRKGRGSTPAVNPFRATRLSQALAAVFLVYVVWWNLRGFEATSPYARHISPPYAKQVASLLHFKKRWKMFASPSRHDGWFVMPGTLKNGDEVELWTGQHGVSWEKPLDISAQYPNARWRKFMSHISRRKKRREVTLNAYADYVCRDWNTRHSGREQLDTFRIFFMLERTRPDYRNVRPKKKLLKTHSCAVNKDPQAVMRKALRQLRYDLDARRRRGDKGSVHYDERRKDSEEEL